MAVFSSQFRALAHGTLNWDTQLDADLLALEQILGGQLASQSDLTSEINTRKSLTDSLRSDLNGEITNRGNSDGNLQNQINARATYDYVNGVRDQVGNDRANGDNAIYSAYDNGRLDGRTNGIASSQVDSRGVWVQAAGAVAGMTNGQATRVGFPSGRFPSGSSPIVVATPNSGASVQPNYATVSSIDDSGFTLTYRRGDGTAATVNWVAMMTR